MHRCWGIREVFELILDSISYPCYPDREWILLALALTCKTFDPALDRCCRWMRLDSLMPLIQCIPTNAWRIDEQGQLNFTRELVSGDLDRFRFYSNRTRSLEILPESFLKGRYHSTANTMYDALRRFSDQSPLFPKLTSLKIMHTQTAEHQLPLLLGPCLSDILYQSSPSCGQLEAIGKIASQIEKICFLSLTPEHYVACQNLFFQMKRLESVTVPMVYQPEAISHICSPHLKVLVTRFPIGPHASILRGGCLSSLISLVTTVTHIPEFYPILPILPGLRYLELALASVEDREQPTFSETRTLFERISLSCLGLQFLKIVGSNDRPCFGFIDTHAYFPLDLSVIEPLFALHNLKDLQIKSIAIYLTEIDAVAIKTVWPGARWGTMFLAVKGCWEEEKGPWPKYFYPLPVDN